MASKDLLGQTIDDSFNILSSLGEGGVGEVYLAEQPKLNRKVAIKFLHVHLVSDAEWLERFRREGKILATLHHPNIARCFAYGYWQNKLPYLVCEYVEGKTLRALMIARGAMPWRFVLQLTVEICHALAYAHESGVVHRDLKPDNIIVFGSDDIPEIKVLDFGLARILNSAGQSYETLTTTGQIVGTVHYMSPEQCLGKKPAASSDLYSLGCIMYEGICGTLPIDADNSVGIIYKHINQYPTPASQLAKGIPQAVDAVLIKSLAKNPEQRYESAKAMAEELAKILECDSEHRLTALNILLPTELRDVLSIKSKRSIKTWQVVLLCFAIGCGALAAFAMSDPGPAALVDSYAAFLPRQKRFSFLESSADFFMQKKRVKAAELLLKKARGELDTQDTIGSARLFSKLAVCSLAMQERSAAISRATDCLAISSLNVQQNSVDSPTIVQAASVIEMAEAPCEPQLERALGIIFSDRANRNNYEAAIYANRALQSLPLPGKDAACLRISILVEGLIRAEIQADNVSIESLIDHASKRTIRLVPCRDSLHYFLEKVQNETKKNGSLNNSRDCIPYFLMQTLISKKAGNEIDRAAFAFCLLELASDSSAFSASPTERKALVNTNVAPILRTFSAMVAARSYLVAHDYQQCQEMIRESILLCRLLDPSDLQNKKRLFNLEGIISQIPADTAKRSQLARFIYSEAKAQGVPLSAEVILAIAQAMAHEGDKSTKAQKELKELLYEASQVTRERNRIESYYLETLIRCAAELQRAGETSAYEVAMRILSRDAQLTHPDELAAFNEFMAEQLRTTHPDQSANYEKKAAECRMIKAKGNLYTDVGKTILH